jgi:hypothetical protein
VSTNGFYRLDGIIVKARDNHRYRDFATIKYGLDLPHSFSEYVPKALVKLEFPTNINYVPARSCNFIA